MSIRPLALCLLAGFTIAQPASAAQTTSNVKREQNWADQVVDSVVVGEPVWLKNRGHKFLALYAPAAGGGGTGVILLHGRGVHPAWGFIDKLRADLADAGFHTLSLQMPILANDAVGSAYNATFPEAYERIDIGIRYLQQKKVARILLVGHSLGARTAVAYVASHPRAPVAGLVAIGLGTDKDAPPALQPVDLLGQLHLPLLDLYGANDLPEVLSFAAARADAAHKAGNRDYTQERVPDADHFFTDRYEALRDDVRTWLLARRK